MSEQQKKGQITIIAKNIKGRASGQILEESKNTKNIAGGMFYQNGKNGGVNNGENKPRKPPLELRVLKVEGPFEIKGGEVYEYKAVKFNKENLTAIELNKLKWTIKYNDGDFIDFQNKQNGNSYVNKEIAIKRIYITSENLLGVKTMKIYPYFKEPSDNVSVTSHLILPNGVYVWTERKGTGHTFLTVHENNNITLYTYGRYDDAYMVSLGTTGEGVLIRYTNFLALEYMKNELYRMNCTVHRIKDVNESNVINIFDKMWNSSTEKPDGKNVPEKVKIYGRVIDDYDLTGNNCTTKTCEVLKKAGTKIFNFDEYFLNKKMYSYKEYFTIPSSLQNFLNKETITNKNIENSTGLMKKTYANILKIDEMKKVGSSGETSGIVGNASGSSGNSSSSEQSSSGSSPASSGGSYGSSTN